MNEVEKMYENAGIEPVLFYDCESYNQKVEKGYLFTAEKQLELIKWLSKDDVVRIEKYTLSGETFYELARTFNDWYDGYKYSYATEKFEEALAGLINDLWQDLTDTDKAQIKEILE